MASSVRTRNNVTVSGAGTQPMLFAHGFGCDQNMWRFVAPAFADDYKLVLFDYVGSGKSDLSAYDEKRYASLDGYAAARWGSAPSSRWCCRTPDGQPVS